MKIRNRTSGSLVEGNSFTPAPQENKEPLEADDVESVMELKILTRTARLKYWFGNGVSAVAHGKVTSLTSEQHFEYSEHFAQNV